MRLVMKFGGTSVATVHHIRRAAEHIRREVNHGHQVAVVVSAMADTTDELVRLCNEAAPFRDAREYDSVVTTGEQITAGLLAMSLQKLEIEARSWLGWQVPILTDDSHGDARIRTIDTEILCQRLNSGEVPVVAGFQGVTPRGRIATLGRGGSDTSAVALAAALCADRCDIYTDVDGVMTTDPRIHSRAQLLPRLSFEEMLELASDGARVLHVRAVGIAFANAIPISIRPGHIRPDSIADRADAIGTLICEENSIMEQNVVSGIAFSANEAKITLSRVPDVPGLAGRVFLPLAEAGINVDMIVQNVSPDDQLNDMTFTLASESLDRALEVLEANRRVIAFEHISGSAEVAKISVIGIGMRSHAGVAAKMFAALGEKNINIFAITTSEIKISVLIASEYTELAVRTLHALFGLDAPDRN